MTQCTIIIPVHNRRATTLACLKRLQVNGDLSQFSVLVVDDGSTDGTAEAIRSSFPGVDVVLGDGHLWWTGAIALGMRRAINSGAEAVGWLNDDCWPAPGTLRALSDAAIGPSAKVVAPACFNADTGEPVPNGFVGRKRVLPGKSHDVTVDGLSGFCVMMPRAVCERIGFPDASRFPHYFGDNAYTLAATRAGFPCVVLGSVRADLAAFHPPPALAGSGAGWRADFRREFISPKSPHRLRTLFAYQRMKYGAVAGTARATCRAVGWMARLVWSSLRS